MKSGNTHTTRRSGNTVVQSLNPGLVVPTKEQVNKLVDLLRNNGIVAAKVIGQTPTERVLEYLEGEFYRPFTHEQCLKAMVFLRKLHGVLAEAEPIGSFHIVKDYGPGSDMIWGDVNASNFLWRDGEVVGIVDYDCVSRGDVWLDVAMALVNWQEDFEYSKSLELLDAYGIEGDWLEKVQKYILLTHKQYADVSFGMNHIKKSRAYCKQRLERLNEQYEKSVVWRSL